MCADGNSLQRYISSLLEPYENPDDPNTTVGFNKDVTLENGIYFNESFQEEAEVEQLLSGVQQAENPIRCRAAIPSGLLPRKTA